MNRLRMKLRPSDTYESNTCRRQVKDVKDIKDVQDATRLKHSDRRNFMRYLHGVPLNARWKWKSPISVSVICRVDYKVAKVGNSPSLL